MATEEELNQLRIELTNALTEQLTAQNDDLKSQINKINNKEKVN